MAKYDSVDRLMQLAADKPGKPGKSAARGGFEAALEANGGSAPATFAQVPGADRTAQAALEAKVTSSERGVPPAAATGSAPGTASEVTAPEPLQAVAQPPAQEPVQAPVQTLARPRPTPGERGRQLLGALRPFLPVVGSALRMVDHGAAQAAARLLPLVGSLGSLGLNDLTSPAGSTNPPRPSDPLSTPAALERLNALDKRQLAAAEDLQALKTRAQAQEDQIRRTRDQMERLSAEQGSLENLAYRLLDRFRLLAAGLIILLILVIAQAVLLAIALRR